MASKRLLLSAAIGLLLSSTWALAQGSGRLEGRITRPDGRGLGGVSVVLNELGAAEITDAKGNFAFAAVPAGAYTVTYTLGTNTVTDTGVAVAAGSTKTLDKTVDWDVSFAETITVFSASRRTERIVEAPAAVTIITEEQIEREASNGQLPKLLEFTPGAELTQSGVYDFNFNTRGFNSSLNRRIQTLIDGRDPSVPFLGAQEWAAISFPNDELASVELVRGPGSALYGADAFNGVLNMVTKAPRYSQGGRIRATAGDLSTRKLDFRYASPVGGDWYFKIIGGYTESDDFARSRNQVVDYPGLNREPIPLEAQDNQIVNGALRFDKYFDGGQALTFEAGTAEIEGPVFVTGIGRVQVVEAERPWGRFNFNTKHFNVMANYTQRDAPRQRSLSSGVNLVLDSERFEFEVQGNTGFANGRGFLVGGVSARTEDIDSLNPQGRQTLMFAPRDEDFQAVFGQVEYNFTDRFKGVFAARWDDSSLHDSQVSPRVSLVYAVNPNHTVRVSYNEAFQVPNYSEFFLAVQVAPPVPLLPIEGICALGSVRCGFDRPVPILAVGNPSLAVEEVESFEIGYSGIISKKLYLTVDYYDNTINNFITDLIGAINPTIGRINPNFQPYAPPANLPAPLAALLLGTLRGALPPTLFAIMSNNPVTGDPIFTALSYVNFGEVDTEGVEIGVNYYINRNWVLDLGYAYFDFEVQRQLAQDPVLPNTAENKYNLGISYIGDRFNAALKYRSVEAFRWAAGIFAGPVPSYDVVNLNANYQVTDHWQVGVDVSNLLDDVHYEIFGGDLLERRALAHISYSW